MGADILGWGKSFLEENVGEDEEDETEESEDANGPTPTDTLEQGL